MSLSDLDQHVFSYFIDHAARDLTIDGRYYIYDDFVLVIKDKIRFDVRKFGDKVAARSEPVAEAFLDRMIERGAITTHEQDIGRPMHQFQVPVYRKVMAGLRAGDEILLKAKEGGDAFWQQAFAALTGDEV